MRVDVEGAHRFDTEPAWKASDWNSACAPLPINAMVRAPGRAMAARGQHRCRRGAQSRGQREIGQQQRKSGLHFGQHAARHHRRQRVLRVARMSVDVLERELDTIADRHQLYHAQR
jgi:hypothetical protein